MLNMTIPRIKMKKLHAIKHINDFLIFMFPCSINVGGATGSG